MSRPNGEGEKQNGGSKPPPYDTLFCKRFFMRHLIRVLRTHLPQGEGLVGTSSTASAVPLPRLRGRLIKRGGSKVSS